MAINIEQLFLRIFGVKSINHKVGKSRLKNFARLLSVEQLVSWWISLRNYPGQDSNRKTIMKVIKEKQQNEKV